ncbi:hypothetical protein GH714_040478 [Hevea brasiliensis]|uniref:Apple domain-containing protein n=1 Tax=Hevea brasiliensis TaxID=3981 RepID=A0A6A6L8S9_HEVBR|nr:hypothetical protein GH714_040478 [Hevea brasiliensis]
MIFVPLCHCLAGFVPNFADEWKSEVYSGGCKRNATLHRGYSSLVNCKSDHFLESYNILLPADPQPLDVGSAQECKSNCLNNCYCTAYAFDNTQCSIWFGDLVFLQQLADFDFTGSTLYVRIAASEFSSSKNSKGIVWGVVASFGVTAVALIGIVLFVIFRRRNRAIKAGKTEERLLKAFGLLDPFLQGNANVDELTRVCKVACWCIQDDITQRPSMGEIVYILQGVLDVNLPPIPRSLEQLSWRPEGVAQVAKEAEALLRWKASLDNQSQALLFSWTTGEAPCNWSGIQCNKAGSVAYVSLTNSGLKGTLESLIITFLSFPNLINLNLSNNSLNGTIPSQIRYLSKLNFLDLSFNSITGSIPQEIGMLRSLTVLELSDNCLSGPIPSFIGNLTKLAILHLGRNQFSGSIPQEVGMLTSLSHLSLSDNNFTGTIPTSIGNLTNLSTLFLDVNKLSGTLPIEMNNMTCLRSFIVFSNRLSGHLPQNICVGGLLIYFATFDNDFTGQMVAVKKFHQSQDGGEIANLKAFRNEIDVLMNIRHRNIVRICGSI